MSDHAHEQRSPVESATLQRVGSQDRDERSTMLDSQTTAKDCARIRMDQAEVTEIFQRHINWRQVMKDLSESGYGTYRVSQVLGVQYWTARNWAVNGGEPGHANGEALLELHKLAAEKPQPVGVPDGEQ